MAYAETVLDALWERQALVPSLWALEACNVIARGEAKGLLTEARSQAFVVLLERLNTATVTATAAHALSDTLHLARRYKLSAYDAAYLELACEPVCRSRRWTQISRRRRRPQACSRSPRIHHRQYPISIVCKIHIAGALHVR